MTQGHAVRTPVENGLSGEPVRARRLAGRGEDDERVSRGGRPASSGRQGRGRFAVHFFDQTLVGPSAALPHLRAENCPTEQAGWLIALAHPRHRVRLVPRRREVGGGGGRCAGGGGGAIGPLFKAGTAGESQRCAGEKADDEEGTAVGFRAGTCTACAR